MSSKRAGLCHARDLVRGLHTIHRIVGPNEVIDKAAIEHWVKDNPE
jgi:hypothetical protein